MLIFEVSRVVRFAFGDIICREQRVVEILRKQAVVIKRNCGQDLVLESIQTDLDYFEETGIKVTLTMLASGGLELKENCVMTGSTPIAITMFTSDGKVLFNSNEKSFEYFSGMFKEACEFYTLLGGVL